MEEKSVDIPDTGLFFGSFNPIHNGHLGIARYLLDNNLCKSVWFIVSPCNPFKVHQNLLPEQLRLEILQTAIENDDRMKACDIEFSMPRPSYTVDTLKKLSACYPDKTFVLIIGADNLANFHKWKDYRFIEEHYRLLVYPRTGSQGRVPCSRRDRRDRFEAWDPALCSRLFDVSSTDIREKINRGEDISDLVPAEALPLILKYYADSFV